jgi:excisionase family DNA binding protein
MIQFRQVLAFHRIYIILTTVICGEIFSFISIVSVISFKFVSNQSIRTMEELKNIKRPSKEEQTTAFESYNALEAVLKEIKDKSPEIEIEETKDKIRIPLKALKLLAKILKAMGDGKPISIVPVAAEMTTQAAAEFLSCSRPHFVKLLEEGKIPFTKIGKHRRVKFEDVSRYKNQMKKEQEDLIIQMMKSDEESGLYDS